MRLKADDEEESSVSENETLSVTEMTEAGPVAFSRSQDSVLQVPLSVWTTLRLGEGQCDVTEACLERMRAGEKCEVRANTGLD